MVFVPAVGTVLVRLLNDEEEVMPSADRNYERMGEVIQEQVSDGISISNPVVSVGDIIFFDEYAYRRFTYDGIDYCIVNLSIPGALWGTVKKEPNASTAGSAVQDTGLPASIPNIPSAQ